MNQKTIIISLETYKLIEELRNSFEETHDEILKRTLLESRFASNQSVLNPINKDGLFWKGIFIENGTELRASYKGVLHTAFVAKGRIVYNNRDYKSPSAAAIDAAGTNINGWTFWEYFDSQNSKWLSITNLRNK